MLILFPSKPQQPRVDVPQPRRCCEFVDSVAGYVARQLDPALRDPFEQHLIHCGPCQRAVYLGRISSPAFSHNRSSVGMPCAAHTRRKP
jgi:putative zinc finger protein